MKYLELVRWKNLLIIALIAVIIRYCIILPAIIYTIPKLGMMSVFSDIDFILLIIAVLSIAGAGNAINDYYDTKTDNINKPEKVLIPKKISQNKAMRVHHGLNILGVLIGLYLSYKADNISFAILFVLPVILLRLYSINFSRMLIIGNIIIAFLAGLVVLTLGTFETLAFDQQFGKYMQSAGIKDSSTPTYVIFMWLLGLAFFSFMITWIREAVKDVADIEGDRFVGAQTIPIKFSVQASKYFILILTVITAIVTLILSAKMEDIKYFKFAFEYGSLIISLLIGVIYLTIKAEEKKSFVLLSNYCKIIMLVGLLYPVVNYFLLYA